MKISICNSNDFDQILALHQSARELQMSKNMVVWPEFDNQIIINGIQEKRQFKIEIDKKIACVWAITLEDKAIWEEKDNNDAIYIHRIATNPKFRGYKFINIIVDWAISHAALHQKPYIRLDTLGENHRLIQLYTEAGFDYLGAFNLKDTSSLPLHYQSGEKCQLFELKI
jgi:ribosomal protein S18 acetylase RimI-like enzyme